MLTQISVFLENRSGQLAQITQILSENGINIRAINIAETSDYGVLRFVSDNSAKSIEVLNENGFIATTAKVVAIAVPDRAGGLNELLEAIKESDTDINYMYSIFGKTDGLAYMIFKVEKPELLEEIFSSAGFTAADGKALGIN